jgi:hypothetical protein
MCRHGYKLRLINTIIYKNTCIFIFISALTENKAVWVFPLPNSLIVVEYTERERERERERGAREV